MKAIPAYLGDGRPGERRRPEAELAAVAADSRRAAACILVSRATGFARVTTTAAVLGPTYFCNLYQTAALLPIILYGLLGGSLLGQLIVPSLVRHLEKGDRATVERLANSFLGVAVATFSVTLVVSLLASPLFLDLVTASMDGMPDRTQTISPGLVLLATLMPQIILYAVAGIGMAIQHAHGRFVLAAAAPVLENVGTVAVLLAWAYLFGQAPDLENITFAQVTLLGLGTTMAVTLHAAAQWWGACRVGVRLVPRAGWQDPEVRRVLRMSISSSGSTSLDSAAFFGLLVVAGSIPGGTAAFQIGHSLFQLPIALVARPVAAAQLPRLARTIRKGGLDEFGAIYRSSLVLISFVTVPMCLLVVAMHETLARATSFGAMADTSGIVLLGACIGSLGLGIVFEALLVGSTSASYARQDVISPCRAMALRLCITAVGLAIAMAGTIDVARLWTLGLTSSAASLGAAAYLHLRQARVLPRPQDSIGRELLSQFMVAAVAIGLGLLIANGLGFASLSVVYDLAFAATAGASSVTCYLVIHAARGSPEVKLVLPELLQVGFKRSHHLRTSRADACASASEPSGKAAMTWSKP